MRTTFNDPPYSWGQISGVREMIIRKGNSYKESYSNKLDEYEPVMKPKEFAFKIANLSVSQRTTLLQIIQEAYLLRGHLLRRVSEGENPWHIKPWLINSYKVPNVVRETQIEIRHLDQNMIEYILDDIRHLYDKVVETNVSKRIFLAMNPEEKKYLMLNQYGFSHALISNNLMRIMGINEPVKLLWAEQLDSFRTIQYGPIKIRYVRNNFYITLSCLISSEELLPRRRAHSKNTLQPSTSIN